MINTNIGSQKKGQTRLKEKGENKMGKAKIFVMCFLVFFLALSIMASAVWAGEKYKITFKEIQKHKAFYDDPRPFLKDGPLAYKNLFSPNLYAKVTYDVEKMKKAWAEVVGFRAPDVVGKIAPEIKPGTYTYEDKEKYPGLKELMIPFQYEKAFKPGGPPHAGNFPEIKVVPTRQYHWALPIAEATKKHMGLTKLDDQGYLINDTYVAGYPFPRPSGKYKTQQIIYNWEKRYYSGENVFHYCMPRGWTKDLKTDTQSLGEMVILRLHGRILLEPYGWLDERARERGESRSYSLVHMAPRDMYGNAFTMLWYLDPNKFDQNLIYISALRRIRKMSATDTQDDVGGGDLIYDDGEGFCQKLSPKRYPYKFELIAEREYLVMAPQWDGSGYLSSQGLEFRNYEFERRPMYVVKLTQMDKNYVYSYRILYIDKETFVPYHVDNYDQKGRLYRTTDLLIGFIPEMGLLFSMGYMGRDHIDLHSTISQMYTIPAAELSRRDISLSHLVKTVK